MADIEPQKPDQTFNRSREILKRGIGISKGIWSTAV